MERLTPLVSEHLHYSIVACAIAVTGAAQLLPFSAIDACVKEDRDEEASQELRDNDKQLQLVFIAALFVAAAAMAVNFYRNRARMAFIFGGAVAAYALRLLSYHALVLPTANAWSDEVCGTDKAISGHAYYFVFHVLLWGVGYLQFCQPRRGGPKARPHRVQKRKANAKKSGGPEISAEELLHFVAGVGYFVAAVCAYLSLTTTYTEGFHSARHMLRGALAASVATLACQVGGAVAEAIVAPFSSKSG